MKIRRKRLYSAVAHQGDLAGTDLGEAELPATDRRRVVEIVVNKARVVKCGRSFSAFHIRGWYFLK